MPRGLELWNVCLLPGEMHHFGAFGRVHRDLYYVIFLSYLYTIQSWHMSTVVYKRNSKTSIQMFCVYVSMCRDVKIQSTNSKIVYGHYVNRNLPSEKKRSFSILFFLSVFALVFVWLTNLFHRCLNRLTAPKRWNMVVWCGASLFLFLPPPLRGTLRDGSFRGPGNNLHRECSCGVILTTKH